MTSQDRMERLRRAVADASRRLECQSQGPQERPAGPLPGDLYVFGTPIAATIEWLVVRLHPDDSALILLAPADDFPLVGRCDVSLKPEFSVRPLTVRCGEAAWVPATVCPDHLRVGAVPDEAITDVRRKLAALARGQIADESAATRVEADPEYLAWLGQVAVARESLERRVGTVPTVRNGVVLPFERFTSERPARLAAEPQMALAANSGGALLTALAESVASDVPRYTETPLASGGMLLLAADASGVRVCWSGAAGVEPPAISAFSAGGRTVAKWRPGPQADFHRAEPVFPWLDGQVVLEFGSEPPETVTVRL